MTEFSSRVDAQRKILKIVNDKPWPKEQLFALNSKAIQRWTSANHLDDSSRLVALLKDASAQIFVMANHSDDPISGTYHLTNQQVRNIEGQIKRELESQSSQ